MDINTMISDTKKEIENLFDEKDDYDRKINTILKNNEEKEKAEVITKDLNVVVEDKIEEEIEDLIGDSAAYYYNDIIRYKFQDKEDFIKKFKEDVLPKKSAYNFNKIIMRIIAEIQKEINEYYRDIINLKDELSSEEIEMYKEEIDVLSKKINVILKYQNEKENEEEVEEETAKNRVVFLFKNNDVSYALKDLDSIPVDYYESFKDLFNTIIDGTFKNVKPFNSSNSKMSGVSEVKDYQDRILFDRVSTHTYCIIACFIKKCDNDKDYREFCENRIAMYKLRKDAIVEDLENEDIIKLNNETLDAFFSYLNQESKNIHKRS